MSDTKVLGDKLKARVLVIGHDPRLQDSHTIAEYCFFADYFFKRIPSKEKQPSEFKKYELAESLFSYIGWITSYNYRANELIVTNICNKELERKPTAKNKTVLIPEECAKDGLATINGIIRNSKIELILAMSQQVNYLLQKLGFYFSTNHYLEESRPKEEAVQLGYYEPIGRSPFLEICGNRYLAGKIPIYPILHVSSIRFGGRIKKSYEGAYLRCIDSIKKI